MSEIEIASPEKGKALVVIPESRGITVKGYAHGLHYAAIFLKPDAIDLGKRLLEHFDVLPTKPELHCVILALDSFMDVCEEYGAMMPGTENRTKIDATIAKLRRLVGEEG